MLGNCLGSEKGPSSEAPKNYNRRWGGNICKYQLKSWKNSFLLQGKKEKKKENFSFSPMDQQATNRLSNAPVTTQSFGFFFFLFSFYSLLASSSPHTPHPLPPQRIPKGFKKPKCVLGCACKPHTPQDRFHSPDFKTESSLTFFLLPFCFLGYLRYLEVTFILSLTHFFFSPNIKKFQNDLFWYWYSCRALSSMKEYQKDTLTWVHHLNL